jgi:hypothetical protein
MGNLKMRQLRTAIAVASILLSVAAWGQLPSRPHTTKPPVEPAPSGSTVPELDTLTLAVAIQARPDQVGYFHSAIESTDVALQQSRELQQLGAAAKSIPTTNAKALQLRDAIDNVDHYNGRFLASFSKLQETELKKLTKRVRKSYSYVAKDFKSVTQLLEPGKVVPEHLKSASANLEKALSDFRSDQIRLGREMGIQSK